MAFVLLAFVFLPWALYTRTARRRVQHQAFEMERASLMVDFLKAREESRALLASLTKANQISRQWADAWYARDQQELARRLRDLRTVGVN